MFNVFRSEHYNKKLDSLDNHEKIRIFKFEQSLKLEPYSGKPLGYEFIREKKFNGKRLIFLVYEVYSSILLITIVDKKAQKREINILKASLDYYKNYIEKVMKN